MEKETETYHDKHQGYWMSIKLRKPKQETKERAMTMITARKELLNYFKSIQGFN